MLKNNFSSIESIIKAAKRGKMFILVDDEKRENEGENAQNNQQNEQVANASNNNPQPQPEEDKDQEHTGIQDQNSFIQELHITRVDARCHRRIKPNNTIRRHNRDLW